MAKLENLHGYVIEVGFSHRPGTGVAKSEKYVILSTKEKAHPHTIDFLAAAQQELLTKLSSREFEIVQTIGEPIMAGSASFDTASVHSYSEGDQWIYFKSNADSQPSS